MVTAGIAVGVALAAGTIVYMCVSKRLAVARAEIRLREDAMQRLREDDAAALRRQADQYAAQISGMNDSISELQKKLEDARRAMNAASEEKTRREAELTAERNKVIELGRQYQDTLVKAEDRFRSLAQTILDERSAKLQSEGEKGMREISGELRKCILDFRARVETINAESIDRNGKLDQRIANLLSRTNEVSAQANSLAEAIRGQAQVTGEWGEMQLKRVLELGGLQESVDYTYQETFASPGADHKDLRTDVLLKMSDGRWMVIDAKATVAAYADLAQAETAETRDAAVKRIIESVKSHVDEMKTAAYHKTLSQVTGKRILGTMLMYIPFEDVYLMAMKAEITVNGEKILLRQYARDNDVVFINSTGLLPVVGMLADFWAVAKADRKAMKIKAAAETLVEKFRVFLESRDDGFLALGKQLAGAVDSYNESIRRLSVGPGNILKKMRDMKEMGVNTESLQSEEEVESKSVELSVIKGPVET